MITYCKGYKHPDDVKVCINDHVITFKEVAEIIIQLIKNEDNIYPPEEGYMGGKMIDDFIVDWRDANTDEQKNDILVKYKIK